MHKPYQYVDIPLMEIPVEKPANMGILFWGPRGNSLSLFVGRGVTMKDPANFWPLDWQKL
jgi:hypothetical protein